MYFGFPFKKFYVLKVNPVRDCFIAVVFVVLLQSEVKFSNGVNPDQCPICKEELGKSVSVIDIDQQRVVA